MGLVCQILFALIEKSVKQECVFVYSFMFDKGERENTHLLVAKWSYRADSWI